MTPSMIKRKLKVMEGSAYDLVDRVEKATANHPDDRIRLGGNRLAEVLEEWLEELQEMHASDDGDFVQRLEQFELRLKLANRKVDTWPKPKRRRKKRKKAA